MMASRSRTIAAQWASLTGLALLAIIMVVVFNSCGLAPTDMAPDPTNIPPGPTVTPILILGWPDVIPGESTEEDVRARLGDPDVEDSDSLLGTDLTTGEYLDVPTWYYDSLEQRTPEICARPCRGMARVYFVDGVVALIYIEIYENEPTLDELMTRLGEPEMSGNTVLPPRHIGEEQLLEQRGIDWRDVTRKWKYAYPSLGTLVSVGPKYEDEDREFAVYYPLDSIPPGDMPVYVVYLFPPMSLEDYCNSMFLFDWMRESCP